MDTKYLFLVIIIVAICRLAFVSANNAKLKSGTVTASCFLSTSSSL